MRNKMQNGKSANNSEITIIKAAYIHFKILVTINHLLFSLKTIRTILSPFSQTLGSLLSKHRRCLFFSKRKVTIKKGKFYMSSHQNDKLVCTHIHDFPFYPPSRWALGPQSPSHPQRPSFVNYPPLSAYLFTKSFPCGFKWNQLFPIFEEALLNSYFLVQLPIKLLLILSQTLKYFSL